MKKGQSRARALRRGVIDQWGNSLKRPFNNSKRTRGRKAQVEAEDMYVYLKTRFQYLRKKGKHDKLVEEQIKKLDEGISNN